MEVSTRNVHFMAEATLLQALYTEWKMNGRLVGVTGVVYGISILWSVYVCSGRRWETWQFNPASSSLGYYLYFCSTNDILRYPDIWMICWEMSKRKENFFWILSIPQLYWRTFHGQQSFMEARELVICPQGQDGIKMGWYCHSKPEWIIFRVATTALFG